MKIFKNGTVVTGDGKTVLEKANVIEVDGLVADVNLYYCLLYTSLLRGFCNREVCEYSQRPEAFSGR